jgi:hypothetical protein
MNMLPCRYQKKVPTPNGPLPTTASSDPSDHSQTSTTEPDDPADDGQSPTGPTDNGLPNTKTPSTTHPLRLSTPFELYYGHRPDYRNLFKWGSIGYYRRVADSGVKRGNFNVQSSVGLAIGRSSHTNGMIFWDPVTCRMNVSSDYKLDPTGSVPGHFPSVCYDGLISPLVLRGGRNATKEPFSPGSKVTIEHDGDFLAGTVTSVPIRDSEDYCVVFEDSAQPYQVSIQKITGEGEPTFHMLSIDPDSPITAAPPRMPEWLQENTHVTILIDGSRRRGTLQSTDKGWTFTQ